MPTNGSILECALKNPMSAGESFDLTTFYVFDDVSALLLTQRLEIRFAVKDGDTQLESGVVTRSVPVDAISEYGLSSR